MPSFAAASVICCQVGSSTNTPSGVSVERPAVRHRLAEVALHLDLALGDHAGGHVDDDRQLAAGRYAEGDRIGRHALLLWSPANLDRWDRDNDGVLEGRQHQTLDTELFGPNSWLTGFYLAALKAAAEMAQHLGDTGAATEYDAPVPEREAVGGRASVQRRVPVSYTHLTLPTKRIV